MTHIGNDIISLSDHQNQLSFSNDRYLKKAFCENEIELIRSQNSYHSWLPYLMWTCKESAYKVRVKEGLRDAFCPINFKVVFNEHLPEYQPSSLLEFSIAGTVNHRASNISTHSTITQGYVHTIGCTDNPTDTSINFGVKNINTQNPHSQGQWARKLLTDHLIGYLGIEKGDMVSINNDRNGVPHIIIKDSKIVIDASLSHDGEFASFAYTIGSE